MTVDDKSCTNPTAILDQYRGRKNGGVAGSTETCMAIALKVWVGRTQLAHQNNLGAFLIPKLAVGPGTLNLCLTLKLRSEEAQGGDGQNSLVSSILAEQNLRIHKITKVKGLAHYKTPQYILIFSSKQKTKNK